MAANPWAIVGYVPLGLPLLLLGVAWTRRDRSNIPFAILTVSSLLLISSGIRNLKLILLGRDYSDRLYTTIEANLLIALILSLYLAIRRRWFAALAAVVLIGGWLYLGTINSVV